MYVCVCDAGQQQAKRNTVATEVMHVHVKRGAAQHSPAACGNAALDVHASSQEAGEHLPHAEYSIANAEARAFPT